MAKKQTNTIDVEKIKKRAKRIEDSHMAQHELFERYREIYFMKNAEKPKNSGVDDKDWKITISPSGRNEVIGMKRLLDTGEIHVEIKSEGKTYQASDKIEEGLKAMLRVSGEMKRARVEKDANLSAALWGPVVMRAESVDDLITAQKNEAYKKRLEKMRKRTPFFISPINAEESYPEWGKFGMLAHVEKYKVAGAELKETWGVTCDEDKEYNVHDYLDLENRVVWADELKETIYSGPHKMDDMNVIVRYSGGSSLFFKPEEQLQSFLYAKAEGEWDKRENLWWTYLFTAIYREGLPGKTILVEATEGTQPEVSADYSAGIRNIVVNGAKATALPSNIIDGDIMQLKNMMDDVSGDSTIRGQTLGENIRGATFSSLAMLSSAGKLPMIDPQEAVEQAFTDMFLHILNRIKEEGIENDLVPPADIPDDIEVIVTMEAKLPQDNLRNAQIASALGDKVSDEWVHTNLLQIGNSEEMKKSIAKDAIYKAMIGKIAQDPQYIDQYIRAALGMGGPQQTPPPQGPGGPMGPQQPPTPDELAMMQQQGQGPMPTPEEMAMMQQGGMEGQPQTDSMIPPQERM